MSAGFTPGPWKVYHDSFSVCAADGHIISTFAEGATADEATANARLIAAAPSMYAALETVERIITSEPFFSTDPELVELCAEVISVLAKARGEQ